MNADWAAAGVAPTEKRLALPIFACACMLGHLGKCQVRQPQLCCQTAHKCPRSSFRVVHSAHGKARQRVAMHVLCIVRSGQSFFFRPSHQPPGTLTSAVLHSCWLYYACVLVLYIRSLYNRVTAVDTKTAVLLSCSLQVVVTHDDQYYDYQQQYA